MGDEDTEGKKKILLEVGCGVGNLIFPLVAENRNSYFIYACDFSSRAIDLVKANELYDTATMKAFTCDITKPDILAEIPLESVDIITMIFVLSAIHPITSSKSQTISSSFSSRVGICFSVTTADTTWRNFVSKLAIKSMKTSTLGKMTRARISSHWMKQKKCLSRLASRFSRTTSSIGERLTRRRTSTCSVGSCRENI